MPLLDHLARDLAELDTHALTRRRRIADTPCDAHMRIDGRDVLAFASNDYLGLANHPVLIEAVAAGARRYGAGSGGSHLLGGHSRAHQTLEDTLAEFCGGFVERPRALSFSTGYMANLAILSAFGGRDTMLFSDALNHASLIDGARLARAAVQIYPHGDTSALAALLEQDEAAGRDVKIIVSDAVFSMDGDSAPLAELVALAERHHAWLVLDDAHGFGVLGADGAGAVAALGLRSPNIIYMATLGKAAGAAGAFVVAHETAIEWLLQRARPYIFTTASAPAIAHAASASIALIRGAEGRARRAQLHTLIADTRAVLAQTHWQTPASASAIQPLIIGANPPTLALAETLLAQGIWVPAIRPPTVAPGTARLRLSLSAAHTRADIARLAEVLLSADRTARTALDAMSDTTRSPHPAPAGADAAPAADLLDAASRLPAPPGRQSFTGCA